MSNLLLGIDLPSSDSDSEFEDMSEGSSSSEEFEISGKRIDDFGRVARTERIFEEMHKDAISSGQSKQSFVLGGEFWLLINRPSPPPPKDRSIQGLQHQLDLLSNSCDIVQDISKFRNRGFNSKDFVNVGKLRNAVDSEMIEITEEAVFAGKKVILKKKISANSEQAKKWLKKQAKLSETTGAASLDNYLSQVRKTKQVNSMDKTAVDWSKYKDERNIDLAEERQKGLLDKVGFLTKVSISVEDQRRDAKRRKMDE